MKYKKLLDASEVVFEGEIEAAYLESLGINPQEQPALTGTATLDNTTNPGDKVEQQATPGAIEPAQVSGPKMPNLSAYPSVFIYGVPGSGKTTFAQEELNKRLALGHEVIVLDPHAAYGAWPCCSVIGGGMNYQAINDKLDWLFKEVKDRYARIEKEPNPKFRPLTITAEEFTKWSANVKNSGELFRTALTDIRQIKIYIVFVSHTRTLIALRNAKGLAPLRDEGLLEVELKGESSQDNEGTGEATHYTLGDIKGEKVASYRDTTGVDRPTFKRILQQCSRATLAGARDYALLRLLWGNAGSAKQNQSVERSRF